jgi:2-polyprenyl-3-methyl-5-hydroxy-6-metoxy-1,4-benzoquinol methylase
MDRKDHWQGVYSSKPDAELSWTQADPHISLFLVAKVCPTGGSVIDVGGGDAPLAGRLVDAGYSVAVMDISNAALTRAAEKLAERADRVRWIDADVTADSTSLGTFDVWHDRAVFHFLSDPNDRAAYVALLTKTVVIDGHAIIATFALDGPEKCSGLEVRRYDSKSLAIEMGPAFELIESVPEQHITPWGKSQSFQYGLFRRIR